MIHAQNEIQITELHKQAFWRFLEEEASKQLNMESILTKAIPGVDQDNARPEDVEKDWFANFFDKCRIVSDEEIQDWWARILAGEANHPGTFSRRTVNVMADLDKSVAKEFLNLNKFRWVINDQPLPLVYEGRDEVYTQNGISFSVLANLEAFGLVRFDSGTGFDLINQQRNLRVSYCGQSVDLTLPLETDNRLELGKVIFTQAGHELSTLCSTTAIEGFFNYIYDIWKGKDLVTPQIP